MNNQLEQYIHSKSLLSRWKGIKKMSNETSILFTFPPPNQIHMKGNHFHPSLFSILLQTKISTIPMNHTHTHTHTHSLSLSLSFSLSLSPVKCIFGDKISSLNVLLSLPMKTYGNKKLSSHNLCHRMS